VRREMTQVFKELEEQRAYQANMLTNLENHKAERLQELTSTKSHFAAEQGRLAKSFQDLGDHPSHHDTVSELHRENAALKAELKKLQHAKFAHGKVYLSAIPEADVPTLAEEVEERPSPTKEDETAVHSAVHRRPAAAPGKSSGAPSFLDFLPSFMDSRGAP